MDRLGALSAFMEAADAGGFTEASRRLGISPSAVSKAVIRLEERLRTRLFHRSTRSITLTPEGRLFLERCRRIAAEMEAAELDLAQIHEAPRGKLRFSLPSAGMPFMPLLAEFQKRYPEIELDIDCSDRLVDVIEEGFDVGASHRRRRGLAADVARDRRLSPGRRRYRRIISGAGLFPKRPTI
jgi:DNA-binding transcriptional LysR family regulator